MKSNFEPSSDGRPAVGTAAGRCLECVHFRNDPATIERSFPGLSAMGSAFADVRAYDGLCGRHGIYLGFSDRCAEFERAIGGGEEAGDRGGLMKGIDRIEARDGPSGIGADFADPRVIQTVGGVNHKPEGQSIGRV